MNADKDDQGHLMAQTRQAGWPRSAGAPGKAERVLEGHGTGDTLACPRVAPLQNLASMPESAVSHPRSSYSSSANPSFSF